MSKVLFLLLTMAFALAASPPVQAQLVSPNNPSVTLNKLFDFDATNAKGPRNPYDTPILVSGELWVTTNKGGFVDSGTLAKYNIATNTMTTLVDLGTSPGGVNNGALPQSSITRVGNLYFYTTSSDGTGARGTVNVYDATPNAAVPNKVLFNAPAAGVLTGNPAGTGAETFPGLFAGNVTYVDRGNNSASLYVMAQQGNINATGGTAFGGIYRIDINTTTLATTSTTLVHSFLGGTAHGRQPFEGFTRVGNTLYFTTFAGGTVGTGSPNGAGVIGTLDLTNDSVNDAFKLLESGDGSLVFPNNNLTYDQASNAMYFTTNGTSTQPGALRKFNLTTGDVTTLYELTGAASASGPFPDGRFAIGPVTLLNGKLYFTAYQGGAASSGTLNQFDLTTNTFIKLFDMDNATGSLYGGEPRGGFVAGESDAFGDHLYLTTRQGGLLDYGTILRMDVVPETSTGLALLTGVGVLLLLRRLRPTHR